MIFLPNMFKRNLLGGFLNRSSGQKRNGIFTVYPSNCQHLGQREIQEDSFAFNQLSDEVVINRSGMLAILADGMGGLKKGNEASQTAVDFFLREYEQNQNGKIAQNLERAIQVANSAVFDLAFDGGESYDIGTTLVAVVIHKEQLFWVSAGDSRAYLFRSGSLVQLTTDHIFANYLYEGVAKGSITLREAEEHPERNHLTSYLGLPELLEIDQNKEPLSIETGDQLMLCSDGLYNTLNEDEIKSVFEAAYDDPATKMVESALSKDNPYQDNITVVVFSCF